MFHTLRLVLQSTFGGMFGLERFLRNLGGGAVMVHRLGRRHIGTRPFETVRKGVQIEDRETKPLQDQTRGLKKRKRSTHQVEGKKGDKKTKFGSGD